MRKIWWLALIALVIIIIAIIPKNSNNETADLPSRESKIPSDAIKITPETDINPPKSLSAEYENPIPLPSPVNTAGGEDSSFILPDGNTLYFWFTPDVRIPAEKQLLDGVTGIYVSKKINNIWNNPERILLQKPGKLALDGCEFVEGNVMLFCSAREGYEGINWFSALFSEKENKWEFDKFVEFPEDYEVGELHEYNNELYYHSSRAGGKGGLDIWIIKRNDDGTWTSPKNLEEVNTERDEGWPALSPDGNELWISKDYGLWRSKKANGTWTAPESMFSSLAGEASIDNEGNVYFTHHYYKDNIMLEADIYFAKKK